MSLPLTVAITSGEGACLHAASATSKSVLERVRATGLRRLKAKAWTCNLYLLGSPREIPGTNQDKSQDRARTKNSHAVLIAFARPRGRCAARAAPVVTCLCRQARCLLGRRRFNAVCTQGSIDHHPHLFRGNSAIDAFAVDEYRRRSIDTQCFGFFCRCAHLCLILFRKAGIEFACYPVSPVSPLHGQCDPTLRNSWSSSGLHR